MIIIKLGADTVKIPKTNKKDYNDFRHNIEVMDQETNKYIKTNEAGTRVININNITSIEFARED